MVELREQCKESPACGKFTEHFLHCTEKVEEGKGFKGEDCVEEMFQYVSTTRVTLSAADYVYYVL